MVTDAQVRLLRRKRMEGKTQSQAAALAGMSERTAREWESGPLPSGTRSTRDWRTRPDPLAGVWETEVVPLLLADVDTVLEATTVLQHVRELKPEYAAQLGEAQLRTLQRRMRRWRALHGQGRDVVFPQDHPAGREGAFDFTHCSELGVTIVGEAFDHLLFTFTLSCSMWTHVSLAYGETFEAMSSGLQDALWALGGVPDVLRHDNLSAATRELRKTGGRALTQRYADFLAHYGASSTRIRAGRSQENGGAEKTNDVVKSALAQALIIRGSRDFESVEAYRLFVSVAVDRRNARHAPAIALELPHLNSLPSVRLPDHTEYRPTVRRWCTIRVAGRTYSVPSRLIGQELVVHQHANELRVYFDGEHTATLPRLRGDTTARIDYRHIIWSLVRKPGAFARYRFRDELFPSLTFRRAYDAIVAWRGERADIEYVRILHLAAATMESTVEVALVQLLGVGQRFDYADVRDLANPGHAEVPVVTIAAPDLSQYDRLLEDAR